MEGQDKYLYTYVMEGLAPAGIGLGSPIISGEAVNPGAPDVAGCRNPHGRTVGHTPYCDPGDVWLKVSMSVDCSQVAGYMYEIRNLDLPDDSVTGTSQLSTDVRIRIAHKCLNIRRRIFGSSHV